MKCRICNGLLALLGVLGTLAHFRCICCGASATADATTIEAPDDEETSG